MSASHFVKSPYHFIQKRKINVQDFPFKGNLKTTLCRCLLTGENACFFLCTRLTQDTCTLHQRKYQSVIFITIKVLNIGTDRSDPDQTATNCEQSDQGLFCFVIPPTTYTGICIHCNKEGRCMTNGPINISSNNISFSVESMLLSDPKLQSQNKKQMLVTSSQQRQEDNDLITLDIHEDSSQTNTKCNHDILPDKQSVKSNKFIPELHSEQETETCTCINPTLTQNKHNPPQNKSIDKPTYTMNKPESHKVCRPKSMIHENTRASSVDTWLSSDTEAVMRRSRSRFRKSIHEVGDSKSRENRRGRSPSSPSVARPTV